MHICTLRKSKTKEIPTELSVKAIVPPGRRTLNASFTNPVIARAGHSWHCRFFRRDVTALVVTKYSVLLIAEMFSDKFMVTTITDFKSM